MERETECKLLNKNAFFPTFSVRLLLFGTYKFNIVFMCVYLNLHIIALKMNVTMCLPIYEYKNKKSLQIENKTVQ